jgi:hypothetical protein
LDGRNLEIELRRTTRILSEGDTHERWHLRVDEPMIRDDNERWNLTKVAPIKIGNH